MYRQIKRESRLPEQEHFAQIVARYEKLRAQMHESTRRAELLFQGLLWESFGKEM